MKISPLLIALFLILTVRSLPLDAAAVTFTYDGAGRLATADYGLGKYITLKYDLNGNLLEQSTTFSLGNAIRVLKVVAGMDETISDDLNGDGKVGLAEAIYTLQAIAGLR